MIALNKIYCENCLDTMKGMPDNALDAIVTDSPYGISFMGKKWDYNVPGIEIWKECLRVLKPGGHLLSFAGTRTHHRMCVNIEDAGFEIRDMIAWVYGSGFPKSMDISKAIDKMAGVERKILYIDKSIARKDGRKGESLGKQQGQTGKVTIPYTPEAEQWEGWGTALKPAMEPITIARKPLSEKTVATNVLKWGTGGINIDGCRIDLIGIENHNTEAKSGLGNNVFGKYANTPKKKTDLPRYNNKGRFPANFIHDGDQLVLDLFPESKGQQGDVKGTEKSRTGGPGTNCYRKYERIPAAKKRGDAGSAARFFYCAKSSKSERGEGNIHPTVKPLKLMQYLCRLITPPDGIIYDPFAGSGTTLIAAAIEGFQFIGSEMEENYCEIYKQRMNK